MTARRKAKLAAAQRWARSIRTAGLAALVVSVVAVGALVYANRSSSSRGSSVKAAVASTVKAAGASASNLA